MTSLTYVFHNFILILTILSVLGKGLRSRGGGGGVTVFFVLLGGDYCFFSITVNGELKIFFGI